MRGRVHASKYSIDTSISLNLIIPWSNCFKLICTNHKNRPMANTLKELEVAETCSGTIQIPVDTLATLISSIDSLRNDVSTLRANLCSLNQSHRHISTQLLSFQKTCGGAGFFLFQDLPLELRTMIWKYALTSIPQVHVLCDKMISRSNVNSVAQSCREAWHIAESLCLDYFLLPTCLPDPEVKLGKYRNFVNLAIDTFWLTRSEKSISQMTLIPSSIDACCGKCVKKPRGHICRCLGNFKFSDSQFPIRTLALNVSAWNEPEPKEVFSDGSYAFWDGTIEILWQCVVQELLIVIGDDPTPTPGAIFAAPDQIYPMWKVDKKFFGIESNQSWSDLEKNIVKSMHEYKDQRASDRAKEFEGNYPF